MLILIIKLLSTIHYSFPKPSQGKTKVKASPVLAHCLRRVACLHIRRFDDSRQWYKRRWVLKSEEEKLESACDVQVKSLKVSALLNISVPAEMPGGQRDMS